MYFGADRGAGMHIFRQRFPDGKVVQITFGPTEEKGLAIAPDGRSLITAVTSDERNVWIHRPSGDQPVSSEGFAGDPTFSSDGKKLFYLWRSTPSTGGFFNGELRSIEVDSGKIDRVLPGIEMEDYAVSTDAKQVVYTAVDSHRKARLWIAPCDRRSAPRQLTASDAADESNPRFGPQDEIFFDSSAHNEVHTFRMRPDGTSREPVSSQPVLASLGLSPDGKWLLARVPGAPRRDHRRHRRVARRGWTSGSALQSGMRHRVVAQRKIFLPDNGRHWRDESQEHLCDSSTTRRDIPA